MGKGTRNIQKGKRQVDEAQGGVSQTQWFPVLSAVFGGWVSLGITEGIYLLPFGLALEEGAVPALLARAQVWRCCLALPWSCLFLRFLLLGSAAVPWGWGTGPG